MSAILSYVLPVIHVLTCLFLIIVVLLQTGKGADVGAVLGGGSQTFFGASGAGNLLTKLTTGMALTFMATSLIIAVGQRQKPSSSLIDRLPEMQATAPVDLPPPAAAPTTPPGDAGPTATADTAAQAAAVPAPSAPVAGDTKAADGAPAPSAPAPAPTAAPAAPAP
jgi:preprotein translocase subunit SecG